jgi:tetratricopeptide (TPR) repeat protein
LKKALKEQIKQDELITGFDHAVAWSIAYKDQVVRGMGVVFVVGAAWGAITYVQGSRKAEADRAYSDAVAIYQAPVATELAPEADKPVGPVYASADEKYKAAAAAFDGVDRRYPTQPVAERARYYAALCRVELKQYAEAEKTLQAVADRKDEPRLVPALARLALADVYRRREEVDKAVDAYRALAGDSALPLPRDFALMQLGSTLEGAKRLAEAASAYRRLSEEFPASVYAAEARRRAEFLKTAAQG